MPGTSSATSTALGASTDLGRRLISLEERYLDFVQSHPDNNCDSLTMWRTTLIAADNAAIVERIMHMNEVSAMGERYPWLKIWRDLLAMCDGRGDFHTRKLHLMLEIWKAGDKSRRQIPPETLRLGIATANERAKSDLHAQKSQRDPIFSYIYLRLVAALITSFWGGDGNVRRSKTRPLHGNSMQSRSQIQESAVATSFPYPGNAPSLYNTATQPDPDTQAGVEISNDPSTTSTIPYMQFQKPVTGEYLNSFVMICLQEVWEFNLQNAESAVQRMYLNLFLELKRPFAELRADPKLLVVCSRIYSLLTHAKTHKREIMKRLIWKVVQIRQDTSCRTICPHVCGDFLDITAPAFELCVSRKDEEDQTIIPKLLKCGLELADSCGNTQQLATMLVQWMKTLSFSSTGTVQLLMSVLHHYLGHWQEATAHLRTIQEQPATVATSLPETHEVLFSITEWLFVIDRKRSLTFAQVKIMLLGILSRKPWSSFMSQTLSDLEKVHRQAYRPFGALGDQVPKAM